MKLIGTLILSACPIIFGFMSSKNFKNNINQIEKIMELINFIICELKYSKTEIKDIINILNKKENFKNLEFLQYIKLEIELKPFPIAWTNSIEKWNCSLSKDDKDLLRSLSNIIGAYDCYSQINALKHIYMRFEESLKNSKKTYLNKGKLYRSLGLLTGAAIFIVLI